jgi:GTP 3',8-cyclase
VSDDRRLEDRYGRPLGTFRLSVTDRCNMRCSYCMPEEDYVWLPRASLLTFEEMDRIAGLFLGLGVRKVRLTGGEPLLRNDLATLIALLRQHPELNDLALTTNGLLLARHARTLAAAGLDRVTISLDTLRPERLQRFARTDRHADVLGGIDAALDAGLPVKLNSVVVRGFNEDEIVDLLEFGRTRGIEVRFIEYMDVGGATRWSREEVVARDEILAGISERLGAVTAIPPSGSLSAPAERFRLEDGTTFGIIASVTAPFCGTCDRSRITADGTWFLCLYADHGVNLRDAIRLGASDEELTRLIIETWRARTDRGAEERLVTPSRGVLYRLDSLRADPRREMHTRGG